MSAVRATIQAGICGFVTDVVARSEDEQNVQFAVESTCEKIRELAERLPAVDAYEELGSGFDGQVHGAVRASLRGCCSGCIVPAGIFKAMQVAAGTALPRDASVCFERLRG